MILSCSDKFKVTTARFANVAEMNLFRWTFISQLKRQPVSCPSDIKRFFVSPEESGQICYYHVFEHGDIFPKLLQSNAWF